jgi:hypothetical protein
MIRDLLRGKPDAAARANVCLVGAGAAGILPAVELLRLGRSAVFPTSGYSNPTHTLPALAMRLAEHLS